MESLTLIFILTSVLIILTPGQDFVLVLSRALTQGKKAGIITALGISIGLLGHTFLAAFGLGAILMASELAFTIIKYLGAMYLIYIGYQLFKNKNLNLETQNLNKVSYKKMFLQGAFSNISNPKITIFYFSYLPQFVLTNTSSESYQLFVLGLTFAILTFFIKASLGFASGAFSLYLKTKKYILKYVFKTSGLVLIFLGIKLALSEKN